MQRQVEIRRHQLWVGKQAVPLISGEVHYWRLKPSYWPAVLEAVRDLGLNIIATYVPWDYHEYARGRFDFDGRTDPRRNLRGFLKLTRDQGFQVIIRPGPYIYSEMPRDGVPAYAYRLHRLHPQFLTYARAYLQKVCAVLRPFWATGKNGHILLLQADNEIDPSPDRHGPQYGVGGKPGLFQDFLAGRYQGDLNRLNAAWGTAYRAFRQAQAFTAPKVAGDAGLPYKGQAGLRRHLDYLAFKQDYSRTYAETIVAMYRDLGVPVPIYLNLYPFHYAHDWRQMHAAADLAGVDLYPVNEFTEDAHEQRKLCDKLRYLGGFSPLPYIAEFESGIWHGRHTEVGVLTPNHYRLLAFTALAAGVQGWNWYMLVNRDNWYQSPITEQGLSKPKWAEAFRQVTTVFRQLEPATLRRQTDIAATFHPLQSAARVLPHENAVLTALYGADLDYDMVDPAAGVGKPHQSLWIGTAPPQFKDHYARRPRLLFYAGNPWLEARAHAKLLAYVRAGGVLAAFQDYPRENETFQPWPALGFEEPSGSFFEFKRELVIQLEMGGPKVTGMSSAFFFDQVTGKKITADCGPYGKRTIGYFKKVGKGGLLHLGVTPNPALVAAIVCHFKAEIGVYSETPGIQTALFTRGRSYYLIVTNNANEDQSARIVIPVLKSTKRIHVRELGETLRGQAFGPVPSMTPAVPWINGALLVDLPRKDGRVFELKRFF
jgi:hypothetical protein